MSEEVRKLFPKNMKYLDALPIANYIEKLLQENKILKENAENNDKIVDKVNWDNKQLKNQLKQRDEVIDKAINTIYSWNFALSNAENDRLKIIIEILQKYKGDNNE